MASAVFDGIADVFTDPSVFGEAVIYTPLATGLAVGATGTINAIWIERSLDVVVGAVGTDAISSSLSVRVADVAAPCENDVAVRVKDGKRMRVSTPILPDGKGLIVCNLVEC